MLSYTLISSFHPEQPVKLTFVFPFAPDSSSSVNVATFGDGIAS